MRIKLYVLFYSSANVYQYHLQMKFFILEADAPYVTHAIPSPIKATHLRFALAISLGGPIHKMRHTKSDLLFETMVRTAGCSSI